jgi:pyruvate formate-lyase/glycerol dehydratase family glycyl radical enzyme
MPPISDAVKKLKEWKPKLDDPLMLLRADYFKAVPEVCIERPEFVTEQHSTMGLLNNPDGPISILKKAQVYRQVLEKRKAVVWHPGGYRRVDKGGSGEARLEYFDVRDSSPFAGSTTSKFKGVPIHPELIGLILWPELHTLSRRPQNPFQINEEEIKKLNYEIFPHWIKKNILEVARRENYPLQFSRQPDGLPLDRLQLMQQLVFYLNSKPLCISHTIPDFKRAIKEGLKGIIEDAQKRGTHSSDETEKEFYQSVSEVLKGIIKYANNLAAKAKSLAAQEPDEDKRKELTKIADIYRRVPEFPAETFREGLTTIWICWTALHLENPNVGLSLGRLDQILYDLYKADVDSKRLTAEKATELVCYFWLKIGDHVPIMNENGEQLFGGTGSNQAISIGGVDGNGEDAVNDLTYVILRATEIMQLRDPNLNARYHLEKNTDEYLRRLCEVNVKTGATPAIHNDRAVIKALQQKGDSVEHARDYGIVGCVEPTSATRSYAHCASCLINLTSALELTLYDGCHRHTGLDELISARTGDPNSFTTYPEFLNAFKTQVEWLVARTTKLNNEFGKTHQKCYPTPILSALFEGPLEKGMDVIQGGALINSSGAAIIGMADTVDSLSAIEALVFHPVAERRVPIGAILRALDENFEGTDQAKVLGERMRAAPKFGNEEPKADQNALFVADTLDRAFSRRENYREGNYRVGYWTMTMHAGFGRVTRALPNGRGKGENFASGITPVSGVTPYLTKTLHSVSSLPASYQSSGAALNLKYVPELDWGNMLKNFAASVKGFFGGKGGMEIQFNIMSRELLEDAKQKPWKYPELLVRVSGYTAYFKDLNPQMQDEIIERTEYILSPGQARPLKPLDVEISEDAEQPSSPKTERDETLTPDETDVGDETPDALPEFLLEQLKKFLTDGLLGGLLMAMNIAFEAGRVGIWEDFYKNIEGFEGVYEFEAIGGARCAAIFKNSDMTVKDDGVDEWDVRVTFKDDEALLKFLLEGADSDVLVAVLNDDVRVEGNLSYVFKFGYMARDLLRRVGLGRRMGGA